MGRQGRVPPGVQILSFSCSFRQNNRLAHPLWELAPPQENPGSATAQRCLFLLEFATFVAKHFYRLTCADCVNAEQDVVVRTTLVLQLA